MNFFDSRIFREGNQSVNLLANMAFMQVILFGGIISSFYFLRLLFVIKGFFFYQNLGLVESICMGFGYYSVVYDY